MKEKEVDIALFYDIEKLIDLQQFTIKNLKKSKVPVSVLRYQEDVLTCLQALANMQENNLTQN